MRETDRTSILTYQRCPREYWYSRHAGGKGLQKKSKGLPLQFGGAFHEGCEVLLTLNPREYLCTNPPTTNVDLAVQRAHNFLRDQFDNHAISFDNETPDDLQKAMEYGQEEQMALAEGLLRGWWSYEGEAFLENFEVIEVEQEGRATLADDLVLMFRPDALVRDKQSGDLYVISWKTCATFQKRNIDQAKHDMQSISEVFGVEQLMGLQSAAEAQEMANKLGTSVAWGTNGTRVEGVLYRWIVKGQRRKDDWTGLYTQGSHLIYGWRKLGSSADDAEWSWSYEWKGEDVNPKTGKLVTHKLGKGWKKVPIWREYPGGVKQWISDLSANQIFPRHIDALQAIFPQSLPVERRKDEVESWKRQVIAQESRIDDSLMALSLGRDQEDLDYHFPQHTNSCHSYSGCSFIPICWENAPAEVGELYQIRSANHPEKGDDE